MGLGPNWSTCSCCPGPREERFPDLTQYTVLDHMDVGPGCIVLVRYHNCVNFGGNKLLVYLKHWIDIDGLLDPHFCHGDHDSPFARFEPTMAGAQAAKHLLERLGDPDQCL